MQKLKILLTNNTLNIHAGTELYLFDVATKLLALGHTPIAFSTDIGAVGEKLRARGIAVVNDLNQIKDAPDIIHGQHHLDTMTALLHFPNVPCVYFCHGWLPWQEAPIVFPRIYHYVAVDQACFDRLRLEGGVSEAKISLLHNAVDLNRFFEKSGFNTQPQNALVLSNNAEKNGFLKPIREACDQLNIKLDVIGKKYGTNVSNTESVLMNYDLVFAKGRSAAEAICTGCAVIICDVPGAGELVSTNNIETMYRNNFGLRMMTQEHCASHFIKEISKYSTSDAKIVCKWLRAKVDIESLINKLIEIYLATIAQHQQALNHNLENELKAASKYLRQISPHIKQWEVRENKVKELETIILDLKTVATQSNENIAQLSNVNNQTSPSSFVSNRISLSDVKDILKKLSPRRLLAAFIRE